MRLPASGWKLNDPAVKARRKCLFAMLLVLLIVASTCLFTTAGPHAQSVGVPEATTGTGPLDGLIFEGNLGPAGQPADVRDRLEFFDGRFVSRECEKRCNYPASPYYVRRDGNSIAFISESRCPDKDAKIVWHGTVEGDRLEGTFTWTVERWYWTIEKTFRFSGTLRTGAPPIASRE